MILGTCEAVPLPPFRHPGDPELRQDRPQAVQGRALQAVHALPALLGHHGGPHGAEEVRGVTVWLPMDG